MDDYRVELAAKLGTSVTTDPQICRSYDHDLGEMPGILLMLFNRTPSAVALPRTDEDVCKALAVAHAYKIPVTPRGQASSGYGGTIPTRGGLLVDLSQMRRVLKIDETNCTCDVQPGVVWTDLEEELAKHGMSVRICPTSGPSSTVGGMFAMGGMGIGSYKYGSILDVVTEINVVGPDGTLRVVNGDELSVYAFSQGSLGIITLLRLKCRRTVPLHKVAIHVPGACLIAPLLNAINQLRPYSVCVLSAGYCTMQAKAAVDTVSAISTGFLVHAVFEEIPDQKFLEDAVNRNNAHILSDSVAEEEWKHRFYPMRIKRNGPALLVGEYIIQARFFAEVCERITAKLKNDTIGFEAFVGADNNMAVLIYIQDSADDVLSLFRMGKAMVPLHEAAKFGGTVYATGLWFNSRTRSALGAERMRRLMKKKLSLDPHNLMNPGKCCGGLRGFLPFALLSWGIWVGTKLIAPVSCFLRARPRCIREHEEG